MQSIRPKKLIKVAQSTISCNGTSISLPGNLARSTLGVNSPNIPKNQCERDTLSCSGVIDLVGLRVKDKVIGTNDD